ncbi:MAG: hypothetical protein KBB52_06785 [Candidatus Omnitrophica bacterium]|nr:hypothetical protein [Candidatus Omnitrophota bacterium]
MKKLLVIAVLCALCAMPVCAEEASTAKVEGQASVAAAAPAKAEEFIVYTDKYNIKNHFIPSGWMGDYGDIALDDGWSQDPHSGKHSIKVTYNAKGAQGAGWMGIYWQNPANNWGTMQGGYDLSDYKKVTFWARGDKGGEVLSEVKMGGITGAYPDSDSTAIGPITLTKEWKQYDIDLKDLDLTSISGGFEFSATARDNPEGFTVYLDDIKYEK